VGFGAYKDDELPRRDRNRRGVIGSEVVCEDDVVDNYQVQHDCELVDPVIFQEKIWVWGEAIPPFEVTRRGRNDYDTYR
jgi:hypothetical protein